MSLRSVKARYEPLKTLGFAAIGAGFTGIVDMAGNPSHIEHPVRIYHIVNNTDKDLLFSWDGLVPFLCLPAGRSYSEDVCANQALSAGLEFPELSRLYVKHNGAAPASGSIYLTVLYGSNY